MIAAKVAAQIKFLPVFRCRACGVEAAGTTGRAEFECASLDDLIKGMQNLRLQAQWMPIGWASYGTPSGDYFKCEKCKS